jgi:hypothetical protein
MRALASHVNSIIQTLGQLQVPASDRVGRPFERLNAKSGEACGDARLMRGSPPRSGLRTYSSNGLGSPAGEDGPTQPAVDELHHTHRTCPTRFLPVGTDAL